MPGSGINSWLEDELRERYRHDRQEVDPDWRQQFEAVPPPPAAAPGDELVPLRGAAARIVENMTASLSIPVATSQRIIPVKVVDENRRIINLHRGLQGGSKVSYTHLITWGILKAIEAFPALNAAYTENNGQAFRIQRRGINFGIAIDLAGRAGSRSLVVPNLKDAGNLDFQ
ncbi:MAG: multifunctional oxoglutarate decarboxylase/oxoglutarate dehydrogenase thiamine pyrophosphate-binding subunit/dihydrolipoyllysine-residue succinyltransferase subunit, partial [Acidobacteriales bacterium]